MPRPDYCRRKAKFVTRMTPWVALGALLMALIDGAYGQMPAVVIDAGVGLLALALGVLLPPIYERQARIAENELDPPPGRH